MTEEEQRKIKIGAERLSSIDKNQDGKNYTENCYKKYHFK